MDGIFLVFKEKNITSQQAVAKIKKKFNLNKVGHTGTLDPLATGLLIVCVNQATKIAEIISDSEKEYIAEIKLGLQTTTADLEGEIINQENTNIKKITLEKVLNNFPKQYKQIIPKYSATKVKGKKLYHYARNNLEIELPKKQVCIKELELLNFNQKDQTFQIRVLVSKGTYIRQLAEDIATNLKTIAVLKNLERTKQWNYDITKAKTIENLEKTDLILLNQLAFPYPKVAIKKEKIKDGQLIDNQYNEKKLVFVNEKQEPLAIYQAYKKDPQKLKPWKMLF